MNVFRVVFLFSLVFFVNGDINDSQCEIEGIEESQWDIEYKNAAINDDEVLEKIFDVTGHIELVKTEEEGKYLKAKVENSKLIVYTTEEFKNFEANEPNSKDPPEIRLIMYFKCKNEANSILSFVQPVTDINNHDPEFSQNEYIYKVPMPLMPGVELINFGTKITAKDIDITNMEIAFSIKPEGDFVVTSEGPIDGLNKEHRAVVKATKHLSFDEKKTYTIKATDAGIPSRSKEATFVIDVDKEASVPESPSFVSALYEATYDNSGDKHKLTLPEEVTLLKNYEKVSFTISGSNSDKFTATQVKEKVQITLKENLPETVLENEKLLALTLTATIEKAEKSATTAILIALPKQNTVESPKFAKSFYTATYDTSENEHKLIVQEPIKLSKIYDNIQVSLSGSNHENFNIAHNEEIVTVSLKNNLPESVLEKENSIVLVITGEIKNADLPAVTNLIVALPKQNSPESPKFLKQSYKANYDDSDSEHKVSFEETIKLAEAYKNPQVSVIGDYKDYFDTKVNGADVSVALNQNFPEEIINKEKLVVLTLSVKAEGIESSGTTILVISMPQKNPTEFPNFEKPYYVATYVDTEQIHSIKFEETIALVKNYENAKVDLSGENSKYFQSEKATNEKEIKITLKENLPETVLESNALLTLTLKVTLDDAEDTTAIVINLPKKDTVESPKFTKSYYTAKYDITQAEHQLIFEEPIKLSKIYDNIQVEISGSQSENFDVAVDEDLVGVAVKHNLPETVLEQENTIVLVITGEIKNMNLRGTTNLVIELPKQNSPEYPKFLKPSYRANYDESGSEHKLSFEETIKLAQTYEEPEITLIGEYKDYFKTEVAGTDISVTLNENFPEETISKEKVVVLTLSVKVKGMENSGNTILVIAMPRRSPIESPSFEKPFYVAAYDDEQQTHSVNFKETIALAKKYENVKIDLSGENSQYFNWEKIEGQTEIKVTLKENLPASILEKESELNLLLSAEIDGAEKKGYSVLVVSLPIANPDKSPQFEEIFYSATYEDKNEQHSITINKEIKLTKNFENAQVDLEGDNKNNFNIEKTNDVVKVTLKENLPESVLESGQALILTIKATVAETYNSGKSVLVINLPKINQQQEVPTFLKDFYKASYENKNSQHRIVLEEDVILSENYENIEFAVADAYKKYFKIEQKSTKVEITLIENFPEEHLEKKSVGVKIGVRYVDKEGEGKTIIVIEMPTRDKIESPTFSKPLYHATYNDKNQEHSIELLEKITLSKNYQGVEIAMDGDHKEFFDFKLSGQEVEVKLKENLPESVLVNGRTVVLTFYAAIEGATYKATAVLVIALPNKESEVITSFSKTHYLGTYKNDKEKHEVEWKESILLSEDYSNINIELAGDQKAYFNFKRTGKNVEVSLEQNLPENVLEMKFILLILYVNNNESIYRGFTVLVVELPNDDGETTTSTTPTTSTQSPEPTVEFTQTEYKFTMKPLTTGEVIGKVEAKAKPNAEKIKYKLEYENGIEASKLHINDDGEIKNLDYLNMGKHYLIVTGVGQESGAKGNAKVIIVVESAVECENEFKTPYALQTEHIVEEEENFNIIEFDTEGENYYYSIIDEYPKQDSENSFVIHPNGSLSCKKINREADIFKEMLVPQITLTLKLNKRESKNERFKRSLFESKREWLYLDNIPNNPQQMIVSVIVDDINDNSPVFEEDNMIVGYPTKELASEISPPYLIVVKATDIDEGYNASIAYRIYTDKAVVHEKSGVVYPTDKIYDNGDFKFKISAIDRDGTGRETSTEVEVKFLTKKHISVLTTENLLLENVEEKLKELSTKTNFKLKYLTASVIPNKKIRKEDYYLHILAYAFNTKDELVSAKELSKALDESEVDDDWKVKPWESLKTEKDEDDEEKVAGLVAAVAVLAVLLVLFLLGAGAFYYFKLRRPYTRMEEDPDASPKFARNPKISNDEPHKVSPVAARRPTGFVFNPPKIEDDDDEDGAKFNEIPLERKKSVAFNENVEKINIDHNTVDQSKL